MRKVSTNSGVPETELKYNRLAREWVGGFLLLGVLVGLLGSLVIAWQYHIDTDPELIGLHFLALNAGYVIAVVTAQRLIARVSIRAVAMTACAIGCLSLLALSFLVPPVLPVWRMAGLAFVGAAGGTLATALLYLLSPYFSAAPAAMVNLTGVLFGWGCLVSTLIVSITYFAGSVQIETALLALIPLIYFVVFAANKLPAARRTVKPREVEDHHGKSLRHVRSIGAALFALLLFFQFGNEWAIAGWLPLFLIHRLGVNPVWAIFALAGYFLALMIGRIAVQPLLAAVSHKRLLLVSVGLAMAGYLVLSFSESLAGVWLAVFVIGAGFAPIYPLVTESLDDRFSYHPGFYNGIFSLAITGAMCAPWLLGYVDGALGIRYVMLLPAFGSVAVFVLALLIMLESHLMADKHRNNTPMRTAAVGRR